jgi:hypothetical protein
VPQLSVERAEDCVLLSIDHDGQHRELEIDLDGGVVNTREVVS